MTNTTTKRHSRTQMDRMKELAKTDPLVYSLALAFLSGAGDVDKELGEHVDDAINYVESTKDIWP